MKKIYFLLFTLISFAAFSQTTVFVNELHYDNAGSDIDEAIEIAGPAGTDLTGWTIEKYNGSNSGSYGTEILSGMIPDQQAGYGTLNFILAANALQNGAPDAIALVDDMGTVIQFLSYEGVITAVDGPANGMTSTDIGVAETSSTAIGESLQLVGTGDTYEEFTWSTTQANTYGLVNTGQTFSAANTPSITITAPTDGAQFAPGTTMVTLSISVQNFVVGNPGGGIDGHIQWSIDSGSGDVMQPMKFDTNDETIAVTNGGSYFIIMDLVDNSDTPIGVQTVVGFDVLAATPVANLAALRLDINTNGTGGYYELQNVPTVTFVRDASNRNQKYIQDSSNAGILIDDSAGTITTTFAIGDGMSGLTGQASSFGGVMQFVPVVNPTVAVGATITPAVVTIATLLTNWEDYESELVQINDAFFTDAGGTFAENTDYIINDASSLQGGSSMVFRTAFDATEVDYIGATIPTGNNNMAVLVSEFSSAPQVTARSLNELTLTVDNFETSQFNIYPNPTSSGYVNITSENNNVIAVSVYDILGKQVMTGNVINNQLNVSTLNTGVYILNITQNGSSITKKLVIK